MPGIVSIVTPSFNQAAFVERTIQSVVSQSVSGWTLEYVVIDGGSTDGSVEVLRRYTERLRWLSEPDRGQASAVNKGLHMTSGDVIGWVNSDDVYWPGAVQTACDFLEQHPDVDVVYGDAEYLDEHDQVIGHYPTEDFDLPRLFDTCFLCQPAVFFRRRLVSRFGALDERLHYALDYEYWLRVALGGARFAHVQRVVAGSRLYPGIKTYAGRLPGHVETNWMLRERLGRVPEGWIYKYAHARLEQTSIDRSKHLRFALGLTLLTLWASMRWNRSIPTGVRRSTTIWLKDGVKLLATSMMSRVR